MSFDQLPRRLILVTSFLGSMTLSFAVNTPALCLTAISGEFGMDKAASGFFLSCAFWGLLVGMLTTGPLADRWGLRVLLVASAFMQGGGLFLTGLAASAWMVFLWAFMVGVGTGMLDALLTPLVCALYPETRTRVSNQLHAFYPIGILFLVGGVVFLFQMHWTWRGIYRLIAVLSLPYGLVFFFLPLPRRLHSGSDRLPTRQLMRMRSFLLLLFAMLLSGITEIGPSQWLPAYIEEGISGTQTGGAIGLLVFGITMATGRVLNSYLIQRLSLRRYFLAGGVLCAAGLLLAAVPTTVFVTVVCLAIVGFGIAGFWPTILACAGDSFPKAGASMFSLMGAMGNSGGIVGPVLIGAVAERWGLRAGIGLLTVAPVMLAIVLLVVLRNRKDTTV